MYVDSYLTTAENQKTKHKEKMVRIREAKKQLLQEQIIASGRPEPSRNMLKSGKKHGRNSKAKIDARREERNEHVEEARRQAEDTWGTNPTLSVKNTLTMV